MTTLWHDGIAVLTRAGGPQQLCNQSLPFAIHSISFWELPAHLINFERIRRFESRRRSFKGRRCSGPPAISKPLLRKGAFRLFALHPEQLRKLSGSVKAEPRSVAAFLRRLRNTDMLARVAEIGTAR